MRCRRHAALLVLPLTVATAACRPPAREAEVAQPLPVVYAAREVNVTEGECTVLTAPCGRVTIRYQEATAGGSDAVRDSVNTYTSHLIVSWLRERVPDAARGATDAVSLAEAYVAEYAAFVEAFPDSVQRWKIEIEQSVVYNTPRVTTAAYAMLDDSGGAHPNELRRLASFDVATGELLGIDDLVTDRARLAEVAETAFRQARGLGPEDGLAAAGFTFPDGRFEVTGNLGVVEEGLMLRWNAYEIAPHAMGPTEVVVPRASLAGLLARDPWRSEPGQ